ncbi:hypothetical protein CHARACLAT_030934 [Characodon lateralis]|uniref:Uncharacterized protein n=1 Tax=Characodon lateralis TaxID=208331 RepID=A0ABU7F7E9_9TELE|nr:hypothetical protein [Characodon lateralis]
MRSMLIFLLHATSICRLVGATLSKTDAKKLQKVEAKSSPAEFSVLDRGLVVADVQWKDIVKEERRFCGHCKKTFDGPVLAYITPVSLHLNKCDQIDAYNIEQLKLASHIITKTYCAFFFKSCFSKGLTKKCLEIKSLAWYYSGTQKF